MRGLKKVDQDIRTGLKYRCRPMKKVREVDKIDADKWLAELIDQYQNLIFSVCYRMTTDYFAAQDLTQETFLSAYRSREQFDGANGKAWLCRIATNKCIDYIREAERRMVPTEDETIDEYAADGGEPENEALEREIQKNLEENCRSLRPPYDEIAYLYFCKEQKPADIAAVKGQNLKSIQTQIYRARVILKGIYREELQISSVKEKRA